MIRAARSMPGVKIDEVRRFMIDSLMAVDAPESEAKAQADLLLYADTCGHFSHGLNRLEYYVNDCKSGACKPAEKPVILMESKATAWVDGRNSLGATVGNFCMDLAVKKARIAGVSWIAAKGCNHYGAANYWVEKAQKQGLIGFSFSNSSAIMVPTRSKERGLGTNPIGMAAPASNCDKIVVDVATTAVAMGKVEIQYRKKEPLPLGWALGFDGKSTTSAKEALKARLLLPLGGEEHTGGHKGYALGAMVEVLCSGLSGSNLVFDVPRWPNVTKPHKEANLGQCYAAIDPRCFAPGFEDRVARLLKTWRNLKPVDPKRPVLVPGDMEHISREKHRAMGAIYYSHQQIKGMNKLAKKYGIKPLEIV